jgi:uncharacterized membrane protein
LTAPEVFLAFIRLVHILGSVAWVGGGIFYLLVLTPTWAEAFDPERSADLRAGIGRRFRELTGTCIVILVVSGIVITFDRLTDPRVSTTYGIVLALKLAFVAFMYLVYIYLGDRATRPRWASPETMLGAGVIVLFLTVVLQLIYENALRAAVV